MLKSTRMWISRLASKLFFDTATIPPDIAGNLAITNNSVTTINGMSRYVMITAFGLKAPPGFIGEVITRVKNASPTCKVDFMSVTYEYDLSRNANSLELRRRNWERIRNAFFTGEKVEGRHVSTKMKQAVDISINTHDEFKKGTLMRRARPVFKLSAENIDALNSGIDALIDYLKRIDVEHTQVSEDVQNLFLELNPLNNKFKKEFDNFEHVIMTPQNLAEMFPVAQSINSDEGIVLGVDLRNNESYRIDFKAGANAKNIYVLGITGTGKTFMVFNWVLRGVAKGFCTSIWDLKGNEFVNITKAVGGKIISFKTGSPYFVNPFKLNPNTDGDKSVYFGEHMTWAAEKLMIMCSDGVTENDKIRRELINSFLDVLYLSIGVTKNNPLTWSATNILTPNEIYLRFKDFATAGLMSSNPKILTGMIESLREYLSDQGIKNHMFKEEILIEDILQAEHILFDFGLLEEKTINPTDFQLRVQDANIIDTSFAFKKKEEGRWIIRVLEENQLAKEYLSAKYSYYMSMTRSMNAVNLMLGNSFTTVLNNPDLASALVNCTVQCIGQTVDSETKKIIEFYGYDKIKADELYSINKDIKRKRDFLIVNKIDEKQKNSVIKVVANNKVINSPLFKFVDYEEEGK